MRKVVHPPEILARVRYLYENTVTPVGDLVAMLGLSRSNFYKRVYEGKWKRRRAKKREFVFARALIAATAEPFIMPEPEHGTAAERRTRLAARRLALDEYRVAVAFKLMAALESAIGVQAKIAEQLGPAEGGEAERAARTAAEMIRSLHEAARLLLPEPRTNSDEAEDDTIPRDIDTFRNALAERIEAFVRAQQGAEEGAAGRA